MYDFLQQWVEKSSGTGRGRDRKCPDCGLTFNEFKASGRFGCPNDYRVFGSRLIPLLERIHGSSEHFGATGEEKSAAAIPVPSSNQSELHKLRTDLKRRVDSEEYEEAAKIRDRIQELEGKLEQEGAGDA